MIISDQHKFAFVHIPKCAGSSVKAANPSIDNSFDRTFENHEFLGPVDLSHLPLWAFQKHLPDVFEKIIEFDSFAVTRDPLERFGSSVTQRCRQYLNYNAADITSDVLVHAAKEAISYLTQDPNSLAPEFIHCTPQARYIRLDGETIVQQEDLPGPFTQLNTFLETQGLTPVSITNRQNATVEPANKALKKILRTVRPLYRAVLPQKLKDTLWLKLIDVGLYAPEADRYAPLIENAEITSFIHDFYAEDFEIFQQARSNDAQRQTHPHSRPSINS